MILLYTTPEQDKITRTGRRRTADRATNLRLTCVRVCVVVCILYYRRDSAAAAPPPPADGPTGSRPSTTVPEPDTRRRAMPPFTTHSVDGVRAYINQPFARIHR